MLTTTVTSLNPHDPMRWAQFKVCLWGGEVSFPAPSLGVVGCGVGSRTERITAGTPIQALDPSLAPDERTPPSYPKALHSFLLPAKEGVTTNKTSNRGCLAGSEGRGYNP